ncbi:tetratricopeptide repeat protein [Sphingomonas sp. RS2018]
MARTIRTCSVAAALLLLAASPVSGAALSGGGSNLTQSVRGERSGAVAGIQTTSSQQAPRKSHTIRPETPEALAAYVRARAADADNRSDIAAPAYATALAGAPGNPVVAARAYREALAAGDMPLVRRSIATLHAAGVAPGDTALIALADAVAAKRWDAADAAADALGKSTLDFLAPSVRAWIAFGRKGSDPLALLPDGDGGNPIGRRFADETRALLLIGGDRVDEGLAQIRAILTANAGNLEFRLAAAELLRGRGRDADAAALLAGDTPALAGLRDRVGKQRAGAAHGLARLFDRLGRDILGSEAATLAVTLTRAALILDRDDDRARLILAEALARSRDPMNALSLLDRIGRRSESAGEAASLRVTILNRAGRTDDAIAAARPLAIAPGATAADAQRLADLLAASGRNDEAATVYATAIARAGAGADWSLYLQQGGALDEAGRWDEARTALARAVALAPDQPLALNYLGYAQVERGENIAAARQLLERAVRLEPDDPNIADSLGWAWHRSGQTAKGAVLLEKAARQAPGDTTINEHLGDVYWALGRRYEARYAWRAAAVEAEPADLTRLTAKIAQGIAD